MREEKDFYIGWKEEVPPENASFLKKILILLFILIPILVFAVVFFQKPFNNFKFEFGKTTSITGTYYENPIPILIADKGMLADSLSHDIILVGYGKFGAKGIIKNIEKDKGSLNGKKITLEGTLIYGDGKTLLELTAAEKALKEVLNMPTKKPLAKLMTKDISLAGEIIDPKCYFGVMKPGEGKIHKSCAIRCISGGIPPVLKTKNKQNLNQYYLLLDQSGQAINKQVLPFVAEQITISGKTNQVSNWDVLYINIDELKIIQNQ